MNASNFRARKAIDAEVERGRAERGADSQRKGTAPPIEETLDELIPEWKILAREMKAAGKTDEEIVAELRRQMNVQMDNLLDIYNALKGGD